MDVAIIGAGNVGSALAGSMTRAGHAVSISATTEDSAREAERETGARAVGSNREAVAAGEVVILAVPTSAIDGLAKEIRDALEGKIVVDVANRIDRQDPALSIDGTSNAERIQAALPGVPVVKAFNHVFAAKIADPEADGTPLDGFVAGDDGNAKAKVLELVGSIGFRGIDAGPLSMARALEALATLIVSLRIRNGWSGRNGWKLVGPTG